MSRKYPNGKSRKSLPSRKNNSALESKAKRFLAYYERRELTQALNIAETIIAEHPNALFGWKAHGTCLMENGLAEASLASLQKALTINPNDVESLSNIAKSYQKLGHYQEALNYLQKALEIEPDNHQANVRISEIFAQQQLNSEAIEHLDRARGSAKESFISQMKKASVLIADRQYDAGLAILEPLVGDNPNNASLHSNLANVYGTMGRFEEAEKHYRHAISLDHNHHIAFSNYYFTAHYNPKHSGNELLNIASEWQPHYAPTVATPRATTEQLDDKRLHIGLVSSGLHSHPVGQMITTALENIPKSAFFLTAYSDKLVDDHISKRIRNATDHWVDIAYLSDEQLAESIRNDKIDILIDMTGHTDGNRLKAIALEPAPLIVKWVGGLFNTTGLDAVDYLLSDHIETPAGVDSKYFEKLIRLPEDYICYVPPSHAPAVGPLPALSSGHITLGCFNNPAKVNETVLKEWAELMHQLPDSRLLLKGGQFTDHRYCESIYAALDQYGIFRDRVTLEGPSKHKELLDTYNRVDIALDPWPYSGGLTTCEAMLMGVPVVTMPGPTFAGRHSATHLVNAGMPELVTNSWDEYRQRVIGLASDLQSLSTIRKHLRDVLLQSPVCDGPRFAKHFATAMRAIWQRYCENKLPAALALDKEGIARFEDEVQPVEILYPEPLDEDQSEFTWEFKGKIIAIDNGSQLLHNDVVRQMLQHKALELIAFDPSSQALEASLQYQEGVHYYPNTALGNGYPGTLYACMDPNLSASIRPLQNNDSPEAIANGSQVLTTMPLNTIALDKIEGLPTVDWLVLDALNDSAAILENGEQALQDTLLIQAKVAFQPSHERQPNLTELSHWASRHGFRFYRLNEPQHHSHLPDYLPSGHRQATELISADALFLPNQERLSRLSDNQLLKLAFLLHTAFGIKDLAYAKLKLVDEKKSQKYLLTEGILEAAPKPSATSPAPDDNNTSSGEFPLPKSPRMSSSERSLFRKALEVAESYFEFGSGGSTVWAVNLGHTVQGVESDQQWVNALKRELGVKCQVETVDIGPTGDWGYPTSSDHRKNFPKYSLAINNHSYPFDLILIDGRFRVACTITSILHILDNHSNPESSRIFIHDFWDRPAYHSVLNYLDVVDRTDTAGIFKIKNNISRSALEKTWLEYAARPE
jgi:protein O-GlcNAc transferase